MRNCLLGRGGGKVQPVRTPAWHIQQDSHNLGIAGKPPQSEGLAVRSLWGEVSASPWSQPHLGSDPKQLSASAWGRDVSKAGASIPR